MVDFNAQKQSEDKMLETCGICVTSAAPYDMLRSMPHTYHTDSLSLLQSPAIEMDNDKYAAMQLQAQVWMLLKLGHQELGPQYRMEFLSTSLQILIDVSHVSI